MASGLTQFDNTFKVASLFVILGICTSSAQAAVQRSQSLNEIKKVMQAQDSLKTDKKGSEVALLIPPPLPLPLESTKKNTPAPSVTPSLQRYDYVDSRPTFDLPVTYNRSVSHWIKYYQGNGRKWFKTWLERSFRYLPVMQDALAKKGLPQDLAYIAMIESGFSPQAVSHAQAVGYWQFIKATANRYGLRTTWWLDERRDFNKSTVAAADYLGDLYRMFGSWYLAAAAYNMGEGRTRRLVDKYKTKNFWELARQSDFPSETREYIPKLIATMLIAKAPGIYGFTDLKPLKAHSYEVFHVPGGTDLYLLAKHMGIEREALLKLNPELVRGYVPKTVSNHRIRIPRGYLAKVSQYVRSNL